MCEHRFFFDAGHEYAWFIDIFPSFCERRSNCVFVAWFGFVQVLFGYLQESERKFLDTSSMCRACKDPAGKPVDPLEQQVGQ